MLIQLRNSYTRDLMLVNSEAILFVLPATPEEKKEYKNPLSMIHLKQAQIPVLESVEEIYLLVTRM